MLGFWGSFTWNVADETDQVPALVGKATKLAQKNWKEKQPTKTPEVSLLHVFLFCFWRTFFFKQKIGEKKLSRVKVMMWMNNCNKQKTIWGARKVPPNFRIFSGESSPCALCCHGVRVAGHHQEVVESCANVLFTPFFFSKKSCKFGSEFKKDITYFSESTDFFR